LCVKNKYMMITFSDLTDFPSEGNSQGEILGFQVIFSGEEFCRLAVLQESKTYTTEKLDQNLSILFLMLWVLLHLKV
jgi:hypothetical protein